MGTGFLHLNNRSGSGTFKATFIDYERLADFAFAKGLVHYSNCQSYIDCFWTSSPMRTITTLILSVLLLASCAGHHPSRSANEGTFDEQPFDYRRHVEKTNALWREADLVLEADDIDSFRRLKPVMAVNLAATGLEGYLEFIPKQAPSGNKLAILVIPEYEYLTAGKIMDEVILDVRDAVRARGYQRFDVEARGWGCYGRFMPMDCRVESRSLRRSDFGRKHRMIFRRTGRTPSPRRFKKQRNIRRKTRPADFGLGNEWCGTFHRFFKSRHYPSSVRRTLIGAGNLLDCPVVVAITPLGAAPARLWLLPPTFRGKQEDHRIDSARPHFQLRIVFN